MGRIQILDGPLVDQIAAGEVVERPASVVKELVENALDAEATTIRVSIVEGGREKITISDDGFGMSPEDAAMCIQRHATSKLQRFEDFDRLRTMGFRGEALPSIASVSRFCLRTRARDAEAGTEVRVEGGDPAQIREVGCAPGTTIEAHDLFFNLPARRKFLKARQTESHHIGETCLRVALAHPALRLVFHREGRLHREYLPCTSRLKRAQQVFPELHFQHLRGELGGGTLEAALGPADQARSGPRNLFLFVNGRPISDRALARTIALGFGDTLRSGLYPRGVVWLDLPPEQVDVNAHPQKTEVRFAQGRQLLDETLRIVAGALSTSSWGEGIHGTSAVAEAEPTKGPSMEAAWSETSRGPMRRGAAYWDARLPSGPTQADREQARRSPIADALRGASQVRERAAPAEETRRKSAPRRKSAAGGAPPEEDGEDAAGPGEDVASPRLIGLHGGVLVIGTADALWLLRPERLAAALLVHALREATPRRLVFPARIELDAEGAAQVQGDALFPLQMEASDLGGGTFAIHTAPACEGIAGTLLAAAAPADLARAALGALASGRDPLEAIALSASTAMKASSGTLQALVRASTDAMRAQAGERLSLEELTSRLP